MIGSRRARQQRAAWGIALALVACASPPVSPPEPDPLALQHQLGRAVDSVDRAICGAPRGCKCVGVEIYCEDVRPEAP